MGKKFQPKKSSDIIAAFDCVVPSEESFEKVPQPTATSSDVEAGNALAATKSAPAAVGAEADDKSSQARELEVEADVDSQTSLVGSPEVRGELVDETRADRSSQERIALIKDAAQTVTHFPDPPVDRHLASVAVVCETDSVASAHSVTSGFENIDPVAGHPVQQQLQQMQLSDNDSYVHIDEDALPFADPMQEGAEQVGDSRFYLPLLHPNDPMTGSGELPSQRRVTSDIDWDWAISFEQFLASMLTEPPLVDYFEAKLDLKPAIDRFRNRRLVERTVSSESDVTTPYRKA